LFGLEYAHIYLRNYIRNINIKNIWCLVSLYLNDFSEEAHKTQSEFEFLRQTPFFPFTKEQEIKAVTFFL